MVTSFTPFVYTYIHTCSFAQNLRYKDLDKDLDDETSYIHTYIHTYKQTCSFGQNFRYKDLDKDLDDEKFYGQEPEDAAEEPEEEEDA